MQHLGFANLQGFRVVRCRLERCQQDRGDGLSLLDRGAYCLHRKVPAIHGERVLNGFDVGGVHVLVC